ncbi:hypothetical protein NQ314_000963 [Rhamnusium bicolor]|uniref:Uncharacterized protein n=1 Tax=Rhamnusium bicolor TaxID=1586634 RepID=A0AAV8ZTI5_9CUCU|nr:hypothetical protein NQ314_000963 [Rhamnusium bicolor]
MRKNRRRFIAGKRKARYGKAYNIYKNWCAKKSAKNVRSETVLLANFRELAKQKKSSTLWSLYCMLRTILVLRERVDMSKYGKLLAFLKRQSIDYNPKKFSTFTKKINKINEFLENASKEFLVQKV